MDSVAVRELTFKSQDGESREIKVNLGKPSEAGTHWVCEIEFHGVYDRVFHANGADSFQAIDLAIGLVKQLLQNCIEEGSELIERDGSPYSGK